MSTNKTKVIFFRVNQEEYQDYAERAEDLGTDLSNYIRIILKKFHQKRQEKGE